ncbi:MAG: ABC transporter ATP-binding protein [Chitinophagaceae bacterium]|nr:ABC transporter ATP-binding protein [Chitinophagaceae bacterium]
MKRLPAQIMRILTREEKTTAGWLLLCDIIVSIADIAFLALLLVIIQHAGHYSVLLVVTFFLLFSCKNLAGFLVYRAQCRQLFRVASRISRDKLTSYLEGGYADYINTDSSVYIREISYEPLEFCQHVLGGVLQMITQATLILLAIAGIVLFNAKLFFLLLVILLPPVIVLSWFLKGRLHSIRQNAQRSSSKSLQHLQEALAGYVESNIYDKNEIFLNKFIHYQREYNSLLSGQMILQGAPVRLIEIFALLGVVILIMIHQWSGTAGDSAVITIGVFMAAAYKIIPGIVKILNLSGQINTYAFTLRKLRTGQTELIKRDRSLEKIRSVQMKGIYFSYNGHPVLRGLDLRMEPGDFLGIEGPSGKGKTTIMNVLLGFLSPDKGKVVINGDDGMRQDYWSRIAYVKQQSFLIHDSILHNITLNGKARDEERLRNAVDAAGLTGVIETFPEKLDKVITENGRNISGGQRQRIALARALYKEADLIILDEPFNELDEESESSLLRHFRQLAQAGKMIILITHNRKSLSFCNKTLSLHEEQIQDIGDVDTCIPGQ